MGILSFLSKKSGDKTRNGLIKTQAYASTTAGTQPVRGTYPVAGNGPHALETLSRTYSKVSLDTSSINERPAPAPAIPRYRDDAVDRPSTAPNGVQTRGGWPANPGRGRKASLRGPPPVSFRAPLPRAGSVTSSTRFNIYDASESISEESTANPPAPLIRSRSNSIRSDGGRGFKDILDAQSELKPADFKARVKATGARDYGEDVADRNLGENGINLESAKVQAFYALSSNAHARSVPWASTSNVSRPYLNDDPFVRPLSKQTAYDHGARTKSLNSSHSYAPIKRLNIPTPDLPEFSSVDTDHSADMMLPTVGTHPRRRSLNTYVPSGSSPGTPRTRSRPSSFQKNGHRDIPHYVAAPPSGLDNLSWDPPSPEFGLDALLGALQASSTMGTPRIASPTTSRYASSSRATARPLSPRGPPRDSVMIAKKRPGNAAMDRVTDDGRSERYTTSERSFSLRPSSRSQRDSVASSVRTSIGGQRHSLHTFQSSISSSAASFDATAVDFTPLAYPYDRPRQVPITRTHAEAASRASEEMGIGGRPLGHPGGVNAIHFEDSEDNTADYAPSPHIRTGQDTRKPRERHKARRSRSWTAQGRHRSQLGDGGSVRHWSLSSATASASDASAGTASSSSLHRPQSRQTADTSIDLGTNHNFSSRRTSRDSLVTNSRAWDPATGVQPDAGNDLFNIDDYVSSDNDSMCATLGPRLGDGEEELLFRDNGYGADDGGQLPGLMQPATPRPSIRMVPRESRGRKSTFGGPRSRSTPPVGRAYSSSLSRHSAAFGPWRRFKARRSSMRSFAGDLSADDEAYESDAASESSVDSWHDAVSEQRRASVASRRSLSLNTSTTLRFPRGTKRLSALGTLFGYSTFGRDSYHEDVIEEEREVDKVDIAAAVKLRKEVKARMRAQRQAKHRERTAERRKSRLVLGNGEAPS